MLKIQKPLYMYTGIEQLTKGMVDGDRFLTAQMGGYSQAKGDG